jgi:hypothetical protein
MSDHGGIETDPWSFSNDVVQNLAAAVKPSLMGCRPALGEARRRLSETAHVGFLVAREASFYGRGTGLTEADYKSKNARTITVCPT